MPVRFPSSPTPRRLLIALVVDLCLVGSLTQTHAATSQEITKLSVIPIRDGMNQIDDLAGDGRRGTIIEAWRDNGNAHGYSVFLIALESQPGRGDWNVVAVQRKPNERERDVVTDDPHTVEDAVSSVRFARGLVGGKPATLLIIGTRELAPSFNLGDPGPVDIEFYRLVQNENVLFGLPPDYFDFVETIRSATPYCNSDLALSKEIGLPLPEPYTGPNRDDGCLH
jgi:hypothetical protein